MNMNRISNDMQQKKLNWNKKENETFNQWMIWKKMWKQIEQHVNDHLTVVTNETQTSINNMLWNLFVSVNNLKNQRMMKEEISFHCVINHFFLNKKMRKFFQLKNRNNLKKWKWLNCRKVIFDSEIDDWSQNTSVFHSNVFNRKNVIIMRFCLHSETMEEFKKEMKWWNLISINGILSICFVYLKKTENSCFLLVLMTSMPKMKDLGGSNSNGKSFTFQQIATGLWRTKIILDSFHTKKQFMSFK